MKPSHAALIVVRVPLVFLLALPPACGQGGAAVPDAGGADASVDARAPDGGGTGDAGTAPDGASDSKTPAYETSTWIGLGGPPGGLGYDIRMRPDDPDDMFVTDMYGGVFHSTDSGASWTASNSGITTLRGPAGDTVPVFCLTIDPNDPDRVWVGTNEASAIYRSDDGGQTWTEMSDGLESGSLTFRGFAVEPGNSDVVYAAGEVPSWMWNGEPKTGVEGVDMTYGVVYKTVDAGLHWSRIWYGRNLARYVWIDPTHTDRIFVSTGIFDRNAGNSDEASDLPGGEGILRSTDAGKTWQVLDESNGLDADELYFGSLYMHPQDPDILLAGSGNALYSFALQRPLGGVYRTTDGGDSWTQTLDGEMISAVEICDGDPDIAYAGGLAGVWRSADNGVTWTQRSAGLWGPPDTVAGFPIDMQCDPRNPDRLFINNYVGGNFLSLDGGATWASASQGYTGALVSAVAVGPDDGRPYVAARSGLFVYDGAAFKGFGTGLARSLEAATVAVDPADDRHVVATLIETSKTPLETRDGGRTWTGITMPGAVLGQQEAVTVLVFSPVSSSRMLAGVAGYHCSRGYSVVPCYNSAGNGLWISVDGGATWDQTHIASGNVTSIAFAPSEPAFAYAAVFGAGIYASQDGGTSWTLANADITGTGEDRWVTLEVHPDQPWTVFAGVADGGVVKSIDAGVTWTGTSTGIGPTVSVFDIVFDPVRHDVLYAASPHLGAFLSRDGGATWNAINQGLSTRAAAHLAVSDDGSVVYLATEGGGVFQLGVP